MGVVRSSWDLPLLLKTAQLKYGAGTARQVEDLQQLVLNNRNSSEQDKLKKVNDFFNRRLQFQDRIPDYWATPLETLAKGGGDCKAFSTIKYMTLKELGIAPGKLRLSYVKAQQSGTPPLSHMVVTYYATPDAEPLILDNLISEIRPASRRPDLVPVFSFNSDGIYAPGQSKTSASIDRLSIWKDVLLRMKIEGIEP